MNTANRMNRDGFTLVELMVVIGIIGILAALLIPTFSAVTTSASSVATQAGIAVLERGLESYRGERALGGVYPPSRSDNPDDPIKIKNPLDTSASTDVSGITGANLLVYAMSGADRQGTPGFNDIDNDGVWWNDMTSVTGGGGAYEISNDEFREPLVARYPSVGGTYVDESTQKGVRSFQQLVNDGVIAVADDGFALGVPEQPVFTDRWGRPILYYRANRGGRRMITTPSGALGVYDIRDNAVITGSNVDGVSYTGIDFGPGVIGTTNFLHAIGQTNLPNADPLLDENGVHNIMSGAGSENTMERFILNTTVTQRNEPVNRDTFLLISAGADAIYGTSDDIVNWTREQQ